MADTFDTFQKGRPNLMICIPAYGGSIITETTMSLIQLSQTLMSHNIGCKFGTLSFPDVTEVRNIFVSIFLDRTPLATHLLFIDSDMAWEPQLIFMKVDGCGAGILMFSREAFSEMLLKMPEIVDPFPIDKHPASELILAQGLTRLLRPFDPIVNMEIGRLSEDLSFSRRWITGCGGEVWANIHHEVGHIGRHEFKASYETFLSAKKEAEAQNAAAQAMRTAAE